MVRDAIDEVRLVPITLQQLAELGSRDARQHGGAGDLVAVQVKDRQHRAIANGIQELVRMPARGERTGFRLAVAHDAGDDELRVVEGRAIGVRQCIAELATLVNRTRSLRRNVTRDAAGKRELTEQSPEAVDVFGDVGVILAVGALEVGVRDQRWTAVSGSRDIDHVEIELADDAVQVCVDEVEPG